MVVNRARDWVRPSVRLVALPSLRYLATVPWLVTGPILLNPPNDAALSCFLQSVTPCVTYLLRLISCEIILWHQQCNTSCATTHSALQEMAHDATYSCWRSSDRHRVQSPRRRYTAMHQSDMEPSVSRSRPLEPARRYHARTHGPGHLLRDLPLTGRKIGLIDVHSYF